MLLILHLINFMRLTFSLCSWKQNHIEFLFIWLYQYIIFEHDLFLVALEFSLFLHLRFFLSIFLWFLISSLSLSLGCGTHLLDKMITWLWVYSPRSPERHPLKWGGDDEIFIPMNPAVFLMYLTYVLCKFSVVKYSCRSIN
jgi:hypothetical protein